MRILRLYQPKNAFTQVLWILFYLLTFVLFVGGLALYLFYPLIPKYFSQYFEAMNLDQMLVSLAKYFDYSQLDAELVAIIHHKLKVLGIASGCYFAGLLFCVNFVIPRKGKKDLVISTKLLKRVTALALAAVTVYAGLAGAMKDARFVTFVKAYCVPSGFIEKNYTNPATTNITFPEKKRNLIHIYLESMENSFLSKDLGGFMDENLIPQLTEMSYEGTVFSNNDGYFGGAQCATGADWSIASMVNQTSGLPQVAPGYRNYYGGETAYFPGAYTLGDLLEKEGYQQTIMIGATARFAKLQHYYHNHGNWTVFDYDYAIDNGYIPEDYDVFWGFEDETLFRLAKDEITRLYETGEPFNFTLETADTHYPDGYITDDDKRLFENDYANALWNSDRRVVAFIDWIKQQPFYDNTTIVLIGDHLSMADNFFEYYGFDDSYLRTQYNCILNPDPSVLEGLDSSVTKNRQWANWDYYPTIVASLGAKIDGNRLGIGTNLYSGEETVFEEYGVDYVNEQLKRFSPFFMHEILKTDNLFDAVYLDVY